MLPCKSKLARARGIIEITHTQGVKKDSRKLVELMREYDVAEGFVYDYKQQLWYRFTQAQPEAVNGSHCEALGQDLAGLKLTRPQACSQSLECAVLSTGGCSPTSCKKLLIFTNSSRFSFSNSTVALPVAVVPMMSK